MPNCPNCGNDIPEKALFCMMCGYDVSSAENTEPQNTPIQPEMPIQPEIPNQPASEQAQPVHNTQQNFAQPQNHNQQVPPQGFEQQWNYQQTPQEYPQYQQAPQYQQSPQYPQKKKNRWVLPVVIIAVVFVLAVAAAILLPKLLDKDNSQNGAQQNQLVNTPEAAVTTAIDDVKSKLKADLPNVVMEAMPDELSPYKNELSTFMSDISNAIIDTIQYKVLNSNVNGDNAIITVEFSVPDFESLSDLSENQVMELGMAMLTGNMKNKIQELMSNLDTITETEDIKAHTEGDKWVAELPDEINDILDELEDYI